MLVIFIIISELDTREVFGYKTNAGFSKMNNLDSEDFAGHDKQLQCHTKP